jgi:hypothetical protein
VVPVIVHVRLLQVSAAAGRAHRMARTARTNTLDWFMKISSFEIHKYASETRLSRFTVAPPAARSASAFHGGG